MLQDLPWSPQLPLEKGVVSELVPQKLGVYQIRPIAALSTAYIGSAIGKFELKQRISQRVSDPSRYLSVFEKQLSQIGLKLEFFFAITNTIEYAKYYEFMLLDSYKTLHENKLPPGNKNMPKNPIGK